MDPGLLSSFHIGENALTEAALPEGSLGFFSLDSQLLGNREKILVRESLSPGEQQRVRFPELPMGCRELG